MTSSVIEVKNLTKIYKLYDKPIDRMKEALSISRKKYNKEYFALNDINFTVKKGETIGIIGTNGAGKSTLLKILTGVLTPTSGEVSVKGKVSALLELGAGFNPEYTGIENIYLNGTMMGYTKEEIDEKVDVILEFADIGDFVYQQVKTYSSGMFVRLAFAVAINIEPDVLIVDEALSVGDVFFQAKCYKKFEDFKKAGKTILFVSHDLGSISKYCDRTILLNKGKVISDGETKDVIDLYKKVLVNQLDFDKGDKNDNKDQINSKVKWKNLLNINPNKLEYGNNMAKIIDFCLTDSNYNITNTIVKGEFFTIKMKVKAIHAIKEPILAFTIKDLKGTEITGTNTMIENISTVTLTDGTLLEINFTQKMNLQGGEYLLSLGCTGFQDGSFTVYHRLYDICNITVLSEKNSVGFYDMDSEIKIIKDIGRYEYGREDW